MIQCACGKPLHYTDRRVEALMMLMVSQHGEYITVRVGQRSWQVQRHYIALHGITAAELSSGVLPFVELGRTS